MCLRQQFQPQQLLAQSYGNVQKLMLKRATIPWMLVGLRFAIAPLLLVDALDGSAGSGFLGGYIIAVLSDIFDGILARRLGVSTVAVRQADSWAGIARELITGVVEAHFNLS